MHTLNPNNNNINPHINPNIPDEIIARRTMPMQVRPPTNPVDPPSVEGVRRAERVEASPFPGLLQLARGVLWIFWAVIACSAIVLGLAFVFRIAGANPDAGFVDWVYRSSDRAMKPFRGIFPTRELGGESVFDASLLFAACAYVAVALVLDGFRRWLGIKVDKQERAITEAKAQLAAGR